LITCGDARLLDLPAAPAAPAALHELTPAAGVNLDTEFARGGSDSPPGCVALGVADALDLVETGDGVAHVPRVVEGLFALFGKRETLSGHPIALTLAQRVASGFPGRHGKPPTMD